MWMLAALVGVLACSPVEHARRAAERAPHERALDRIRLVFDGSVAARRERQQ
jgi:hypothetical protein